MNKMIFFIDFLLITDELSPYLPMEDASDIATTTIFPKLYFFPWITKPIGEFQEFNDTNENGDGRSNSSKRPNESNTTNSQDFGESTFQFVIKFDILPVVGNFNDRLCIE